MTTEQSVDHSAIDHDAPFDKLLRVSMSEITYDEAMKAINAGLEKARQLDICIVIVVTDSHGADVALARMDGTRHMCTNIARGRAKYAGWWGLPAKRFTAGMRDRSPILDIDNFENSHGASQGGQPLYRNGEIIGGIGVSGGHGSGGLGLPDDEVARAGARALSNEAVIQ